MPGLILESTVNGTTTFFSPSLPRIVPRLFGRGSPRVNPCGGVLALTTGRGYQDADASVTKGNNDDTPFPYRPIGDRRRARSGRRRGQCAGYRQRRSQIAEY